MKHIYKLEYYKGGRRILVVNSGPNWQTVLVNLRNAWWNTFDGVYIVQDSATVLGFMKSPRVGQISPV